MVRTGAACVRFLAALACLTTFTAGPARADRFRMGLPTPPGHVWTVAAEAKQKKSAKLAS